MRRLYVLCVVEFLRKTKIIIMNLIRHIVVKDEKAEAILFCLLYAKQTINR